MNYELDMWWTNLTTVQKSRIATKVARKADPNAKPVEYPACTTWWIILDDEQKQKIHDHCVDKHGYLLKEYKEGQSMSY